LSRFLKEQLMKLQDFYSKSSSSSSSSLANASNAAAYNNGNPLMTDEQKLALRQFNYCQQLCKVMFEVREFTLTDSTKHGKKFD